MKYLYAFPPLLVELRKSQPQGEEMLKNRDKKSFVIQKVIANDESYKGSNPADMGSSS